MGKNRKKHIYSKFIATSPRLYVEEFENLWNHVSNSVKAENTRRAIKAWRPGQRTNLK